LFYNKPLIDELWQHAKNILSLKTPETYKDEITRVISDLNPIGFVKKLKNNIIIIQSTEDEVLEPKLAKKFYSLINSKKSYVEMPNKKHDLMGDEKELIDALRFHIK
jgi:esterase/lipase